MKGDDVAMWACAAAMGSLALAIIIGGALLLRSIRETRLLDMAAMLVKSAEQIYGPGKGNAKRQFVREQLKQAGMAQVSRAALEAAVYELSHPEAPPPSGGKGAR